MENHQESFNGKNTPPKKSIKWKVFLILALVLIGVGAYGYYWMRQTNQLRKAATEVLGRAQQYDVLRSAIDTERQRCENFIAQKEGDFGSFEYCRKFIDWSDTVPAVK